jgi:hypothetical protein
VTKKVTDFLTKTNVSRRLIKTNYGISVLYQKINGVRILHIEGNPSGQIGTGGHTISLSDTIADSDPYYRVITQSVSANNAYAISLLNNSITIKPYSSTTAYVNATFVY